MKRHILFIIFSVFIAFNSLASTKLYYTEPKSKPVGKLVYHEPKSNSPGQLVYTEPTPIVEFALERINKVQNISSSINNLPKTSYCSECNITSNSSKFQQCTNENNYLERNISRAIQSSTFISNIINQEPSQNSIIKNSCIRMGMEAKFSVRSKSFKTCSANQNSTGANSSYRPCITENYFNLVNNSFDVVSRCMKNFINDGDEQSQNQDVLSAYSLINIESGFHVNAISPTGAAGIGQFTYGAIDTVNRNQFEKMKAHLAKSNNQECNKLGEEILKNKMSPNAGNNCERISIEDGNPLKNMLYTFSYLKTSKTELSKSIFENDSYKNKFHLSDSDKEKIQRAMMVWAHNAGPAGTWTPAKALLNSKYRNTKVTNADIFIQDLEKFMKKFPASANKKSSRRLETSQYFPKISATLNDIENSAGGGSCLN